MLNSQVIDLHATKQMYAYTVAGTTIPVTEIFISKIQGIALGIKVPGVTEVRIRRFLSEHGIKTKLIA